MRLSKVLVVLASASLAFAQQAFFSRSIVVASKEDSESGATGEDIFRHASNGVLAASSILRQSAKLVGYAPSVQKPHNNYDVFRAFEWKVSKFPGFKEPKVARKLFELEGGLEDLEKAVKSNYDSYENGLVAKTLRAMVPETNLYPDTKQIGLNLVSINKRRASQHTYVKMITLRIEIDTDEDGQVSIVQQIGSLLIEEYELDSSYLSEHAEKLASKIDKAGPHEFERYFRTAKSATMETSCQNPFGI